MSGQRGRKAAKPVGSTATRPTVTGITDLQTVIHRVVKDKKYAKYDHLLPGTFNHTTTTLTLNNVSNAIANGIRRCIMSEIPVKILTFDIDKYETNDEFLSLSEMLQRRINNIPICQTVSKQAVFFIDYKNAVAENADVKTKDIILDKKTSKSDTTQLFDQTITVTRLRMGKFLKIPHIYVIEGIGRDNAAFSVVQSATINPIGVDMYNMYTNTGVRSSVADCRNYTLKFSTNGNVDIKTVLKTAINSLIDRLILIAKNLSGNIHIMENGVYAITLMNMSDTIGNIILRGVTDQYDNIDITYKVDFNNNVLTLRIRSDTPAEHINSGIDYSVDILRKLYATV